MIAIPPQSYEGIGADELLGPEGIISQAHTDFESRPQQLDMARKVQHAMRSGFNLAVEAGTGVGKSYAYLAGAIDQAIRKEGRVLISTFTINLQHQLITKDIPFLAEFFPGQFNAELAKGRGNYLCHRRLDYAKRQGKGGFDADTAQLAEIADWAATTQDGTLSDMPLMPSAKVWQQVQSEHGNCKGRKCDYYNRCFYWKARRKLDQADIIVANHALMFSDLMLKEKGIGILPEYTSVIVDEAHTMESVAEDHFGIRVSQYSVTYLLDSLYNTHKRKGFLAFKTAAEEARGLVGQCIEAAKVFFAQVQAWYAHAGDETDGQCDVDFVDDNLTGPLRELRLALNKLAKTYDDEDDDKFELNRYIDQCGALEKDLKDFLKQSREGCVYWVEVEQNRYRRTVLRGAPLDVGPYVKRCLFEPYSSVVLTSATLSIGKDSKTAFAFFAGRVGLDDYEGLQLGSPFDYQRQATLYIEAEMPEPMEPDYRQAAAEAIKKYLLKSDGAAFVLFTSYSMLKDMTSRLGDWLEEQDMELLAQGSGVDRARLLAEFKEDQRSVLFGTDSFWQGVDVPGESLKNVMIVRLPFAVPSHPLIKGRIEKMRADGKNPFFDYQLPMAIIKFKQGIGRLIRNKTDEGIIVILDSRIVKKRYGKRFINSLPDCRVEIVGPEQEL